jgi:glycerate kinase
MNNIGEPVRKVLCAPDSFKETLSAVEVAEAMAVGIRQANPDVVCDCCPVGDGGEGTLDALVHAMQLKLRQAEVTGPVGSPVMASFGICKARRLGVIELAQASGLAIVRAQARNPLETTTYGTGELIREAMSCGCDEVIVCVGGSATIDAGVGVLQALGVRFFASNDREIAPPITGGVVKRIARIEIGQARSFPRIRVACDVTNPLYGPHGAAFTYGAQKGATPDQQSGLDDAMRCFASICAAQGLSADPNAAGAGAAGGVPFGLAAICGATLERGIDLVLDAIDFRTRCAGASLVLTGEGRLDSQSLHGKACLGVAASAAKCNVPTIAIVGSTGPGAEDAADVSKGGQLQGWISLSDRFSFEQAMRQPAMLITRTCFELFRELSKRAEQLPG